MMKEREQLKFRHKGLASCAPGSNRNKTIAKSSLISLQLAGLNHKALPTQCKLIYKLGTALIEACILSLHNYKDNTIWQPET